MARTLTKVAAAGAAALAAVAVPMAAFAAGTGSGGSTAVPGPSGVPGGYQTVVSSQQIGQDGVTISGTDPTSSDRFTATVPSSDTNLVNDIFTVTSGTASQIAETGYSAVLALGFDFNTDDTLTTKVSGTFTSPVQVSIVGSFPAGTQVVYWNTNTTSWSPVPTSASTTTPADGYAYTQAELSFQLTQDPDIAVVVPAGSTTAVGAATAAAGGTGAVGNVAGATDVSTGKPFLLEGVLAVMLVGVGGTLAWRFKRLRSLRRG